MVSKQGTNERILCHIRIKYSIIAYQQGSVRNHVPPDGYDIHRLTIVNNVKRLVLCDVLVNVSALIILELITVEPYSSGCRRYRTRGERKLSDNCHRNSDSYFHSAKFIFTIYEDLFYLVNVLLTKIFGRAKFGYYLNNNCLWCLWGVEKYSILYDTMHEWKFFLCIELNQIKKTISKKIKKYWD